MADTLLQQDSCVSLLAALKAAMPACFYQGLKYRGRKPQAELSKDCRVHPLASFVQKHLTVHQMSALIGTACSTALTPSIRRAREASVELFTK